jgi:DNA processing protein
MDTTRYYLGFNLTPGIGPARIARLVEHFGSVGAAWEASRADLLACGLDVKRCDALLDTRRRVDLDNELERVWQAGARAISVEDADYPALLRQVPQAPPLIYVRGALAAADEWALAVVGTRGPTSYGKEAARRFAGDLAASGVTIVSGLAIGVDTVAHTAALEAGGRTIAVLGCGVDIPYPPRNTRLAEQIAQQGALISEYPLGTLPAAANFPPRNRLISGLSLGTLVVEAGARSGALITVTFALEQGREVFAVPGSIFSQASAGTNQLIRDGAALVTCAADVLQALNWTAVAEQQEVQLAFPTDDTEAALLEVLDYEPRHVDELTRGSGLAPQAAAAALALMELRGVVRHTGGMHYVRVREARAAYAPNPNHPIDEGERATLMGLDRRVTERERPTSDP